MKPQLFWRQPVVKSDHLSFNYEINYEERSKKILK